MDEWVPLWLHVRYWFPKQEQEMPVEVVDSILEVAALALVRRDPWSFFDPPKLNTRQSLNCLYESLASDSNSNAAKLKTSKSSSSTLRKKLASWATLASPKPRPTKKPSAAGRGRGLQPNDFDSLNCQEIVQLVLEIVGRSRIQFLPPETCELIHMTEKDMLPRLVTHLLSDPSRPLPASAKSLLSVATYCSLAWSLAMGSSPSLTSASTTTTSTRMTTPPTMKTIIMAHKVQMDTSYPPTLAQASSYSSTSSSASSSSTGYNKDFKQQQTFAKNPPNPNIFVKLAHAMAGSHCLDAGHSHHRPSRDRAEKDRQREILNHARTLAAAADTNEEGISSTVSVRKRSTRRLSSASADLISLKDFSQQGEHDSGDDDITGLEDGGHHRDHRRSSSSSYDSILSSTSATIRWCHACVQSLEIMINSSASNLVQDGFRLFPVSEVLEDQQRPKSQLVLGFTPFLDEPDEEPAFAGSDPLNAAAAPPKVRSPTRKHRQPCQDHEQTKQKRKPRQQQQQQEHASLVDKNNKSGPQSNSPVKKPKSAGEFDSTPHNIAEEDSFKQPTLAQACDDDHHHHSNLTNNSASDADSTHSNHDKEKHSGSSSNSMFSSGSDSDDFAFDRDEPYLRKDEDVANDEGGQEDEDDDVDHEMEETHMVRRRRRRNRRIILPVIPAKDGTYTISSASSVASSSLSAGKQHKKNRSSKQRSIGTQSHGHTSNLPHSESDREVATAGGGAAAAEESSSDESQRSSVWSLRSGSQRSINSSNIGSPLTPASTLQYQNHHQYPEDHKLHHPSPPISPFGHYTSNPIPGLEQILENDSQNHHSEPSNHCNNSNNNEGDENTQDKYHYNHARYSTEALTALMQNASLGESLPLSTSPASSAASISPPPLPTHASQLAQGPHHEIKGRPSKPRFPASQLQSDAVSAFANLTGLGGDKNGSTEARSSPNLGVQQQQHYLEHYRQILGARSETNLASSLGRGGQRSRSMSSAALLQQQYQQRDMYEDFEEDFYDSEEYDDDSLDALFLTLDEYNKLDPKEQARYAEQPSTPTAAEQATLLTNSVSENRQKPGRATVGGRQRSRTLNPDGTSFIGIGTAESLVVKNGQPVRKFQRIRSDAAKKRLLVDDAQLKKEQVEKIKAQLERKPLGKIRQVVSFWEEKRILEQKVIGVVEVEDEAVAAALAATKAAAAVKTEPRSS